MAKITFQDEQGQNLNRYKMTPVEGQADTYDLERAANITQQGTPISADNMNHMAQDEDVAELAGPNRTTETVKGNADALTAHKNDNNNPHGVTAEQTGSIPISQKGTSGGVANYDDLAAHTSNAGIHVTAAQKTAWTAKAEKSSISTATLPASGWTGSDAPYSQTISVAAVTATSANELLPGASITADQLDALQSANIQDGGQAAGHITLLAYGDKPGIDLPVRVIVRGDL